MCLFIQALKTLMWMSPGLDLDGIVGVSCTGEAMLSCCPRRVTAIMLAPGATGPKQIYIDLFARAGFRIISPPKGMGLHWVANIREHNFLTIRQP